AGFPAGARALRAGQRCAERRRACRKAGRLIGMFLRSGRVNVEIGTERLILRPPRQGDFVSWARLRRESRDFLTPWEPSWSKDHLAARSFRNRVAWAERVIRQEEALPLFLIRHEGEELKEEELIGG